jgi:hypothetical protein
MQFINENQRKKLKQTEEIREIGWICVLILLPLKAPIIWTIIEWG